MKKILFLILLAIVAIVGYFYIKAHYGDLRPSLLPSRSVASILNQEETQPVSAKIGEAVNTPLKLPAGYQMGLFSKDTPGARDLEFSPAGTLLVSLTGQGKVVALPDKNKDGIADEAVTVINGLNKPHGLLFNRTGDHNELFVAEETRLVRYICDENTLTTTLDKELLKLPSGGRHFTRSLAMDKEGRLYMSLGSTCDTCFEANSWLATVIATDRDGNNPHVYSKGLRNAVFIALNDRTDQIWATEMGRDYLGDETPPDEIDILREGADYGWPVCYGDKLYDKTFNGKSANYCDSTISPIFKIAAHSAPLGLTFINSSQMPAEWQGDLLVAYHGSWNRTTPIGYKIVRMKVQGEQIVGESDFITGFLQGSEALGRPVDLAFDPEGSLYISDDKSGAVYKLVKK